MRQIQQNKGKDLIQMFIKILKNIKLLGMGIYQVGIRKENLNMQQEIKTTRSFKANQTVLRNQQRSIGKMILVPWRLKELLIFQIWNIIQDDQNLLKLQKRKIGIKQAVDQIKHSKYAAQVGPRDKRNSAITRDGKMHTKGKFENK